MNISIQVTENHLLVVNEKRRCRMAKHSLKSTGIRDEFSITLYLQSEIYLCSVRMPVNA